MKRAFLLLFSLFLASAAMGQNSTSDSFEEAKKKGTAKLNVLYSEQAHFTYTEDSGEIGGIAADIFKHFANFLRYNYKIELDVNYVPHPNFTKFMAAVKEGGHGDLGLGNITITEARKSEYSFSPAFYNNVAVLVTGKSTADLTGLNKISSDFAGYEAVTVKNTTYEKYVLDLKANYFPGLTIRYVENDIAMASELRTNGKVLAYIDYHRYHDFRAQLKRHEVGDLSGEEFGFAMPKGCDWKTAWDEFFAFGTGYRNSNLYRSVITSHLGREGANVLRKYYADRNDGR